MAVGSKGRRRESTAYEAVPGSAMSTIISLAVYASRQTCRVFVSEPRQPVGRNGSFVVSGKRVIMPTTTPTSTRGFFTSSTFLANGFDAFMGSATGRLRTTIGGFGLFMGFGRSVSPTTAISHFCSL